jgi:hypothetical protein
MPACPKPTKRPKATRTRIARYVRPKAKRATPREGGVVAALFVATNGIYFGRPDVDPWDEKRDARLYAGPHPVVAHPPCERWGALWFGGMILHRQGKRKKLGDDGGCFASALASVRAWGGVLEHPAYSRAWRAYGMPAPKAQGWWRDVFGGWCAHVEQGHYGHRARKATWLYYVGAHAPPSLIWGKSPATERISTLGGRRREGNPAGRYFANNKKARAASPPAFMELLLSIARNAVAARAA